MVYGLNLSGPASDEELERPPGTLYDPCCSTIPHTAKTEGWERSRSEIMTVLLLPVQNFRKNITTEPLPVHAFLPPDWFCHIQLWHGDAPVIQRPVCLAVQRKPCDLSHSNCQSPQIQIFTNGTKKHPVLIHYVSPCACLTSKGETVCQEYHHQTKSSVFSLSKSPQCCIYIPLRVGFTKWLLNLPPYLLLTEKEFLIKPFKQGDLVLSTYVKIYIQELCSECNAKNNKLV